jgi:hypothetical protein
VTRSVPGRLIDQALLAVAATPAGPWHRALDATNRRPACDPQAPRAGYEHDVSLIPKAERCAVCWQDVQHVQAP